MGLALSFDGLHRILYIRFDGTITNAEASLYYKRLSEWFAAHGHCSNICDFSAVTSFEVSASKVRQLAANEPLVPDGNLRIIVAPQDLIFGYARMYEISGSNTRDHVHVVRTLAEAYRLLDVESLELSA
jgi:hypothetical protein